MGYYGSYGGFAPYISVAEKKRRAEKVKEKLMKKKGVILEPIVLDGKTIAHSWWGKSWNSNMERYSDYAYRLDRGRSYVRAGSVIDLKIVSGEIQALVMGSDPEPYNITIKIDKINSSALEVLMETSRGALDSMQALLRGEFPVALKDAFFAQGSGLFPSPKEIHLSCSCPDIARMCKHVAAAMYGVSARLDRKPELFFLLRGIDIDTFVKDLIEKEHKKVLSLSETKSERDIVADNGELSELFGIEMDMVPEEETVKKPVKKSVKKIAKKSLKKDSNGTANSIETKPVKKGTPVKKLPEFVKKVSTKVVKKKAIAEKPLKKKR